MDGGLGRVGRVCWDSTCVDTFCSTSVADTAVTPGAAATRAERRKQERYSDLTDRSLFEPVTVETAGTFGKYPEVLKTFRETYPKSNR